MFERKKPGFNRILSLSFLFLKIKFIFLTNLIGRRNCDAQINARATPASQLRYRPDC